jgi:hypothetical protein
MARKKRKGQSGARFKFELAEKKLEKFVNRRESRRRKKQCGEGANEQ